MTTPQRFPVVRVLVLTWLLAFVIPSPAAGQLGGLQKKLGKAVTEAVGGETEAAPGATAAPPAQEPSFDREYVVAIDGAMLDRLAAGLAAEHAERQQVAAILAALPSAEERGQCQMRVAQGAEIQALLADYTAAIEKAGEDQQAIMAAAQAMETKMRTAYDRECGEELTSEREQELQQRPELAGADAAGLTDIQYGILKERITPFCSAGAALQRSATGGSVPVAGTTVAYVYGAAEIDALTPRCDALRAALADAA